ncbi:hypothetical protein PQQ51_33510 [Paraburkholderia xenovorans]|uniref:hypothetical protein n=1 Tax=Paraburkholderia xenovorans TaxID=36873 RepID=UPI0038BBBA81
MREAIQRECDRQRVAVLSKEAADARVRSLESILGDLTCQAQFVDLLRATGFGQILRLIYERLRKQARKIGANATPLVVGTGLADRRVSAAINEKEPPVISDSGQFCVRTRQALARMTTLRQIDVINLMCSSGNYAGDFAQALLAATSRDQRVVVPRELHYDQNRTRSFARVEKRLVRFHQRNQLLSVGYSENLIFLAVCCSYVRSLMQCHDVVVWLKSRYPLHAAALAQVATYADCAKEPKRSMKLPYIRNNSTTVLAPTASRPCSRGRSRTL